MKIFINCTIFFCMVQLFLSCYSQKMLTDNGIAVLKIKYFDSSSGKYRTAVNDKDRMFWYKSNFIIEEVHHIYQNTDISQNATWEVLVERYKFADMQKREIWEYYTFSDTAAMIKKCTPEDTGCRRETWVFWTETQQMMPDGLRENLRDTIINNIQYKRVRIMQHIKDKKGEMRFYTLGYFRCDMTNVPYMFDKAYSKKVGCPLVRVDMYYEPAFYPAAIAEVEYLPRKLNPIELKVFSAWEENAKNYSDKK